MTISLNRSGLFRLLLTTFALPALLFAQGCASAPASVAASQSPRAERPVKAATRGLEEATLAAGCFWSMEAIFKQLNGVRSVEPGYAGGKVSNPSYEEVETGSTGHAESVNIIYDPRVISFGTLLRVLLTVRDPTTVDRQGPDSGSQYRSIIFYRNDDQKKVALQAVRDISAAHVWSDPIVTRVEPFTHFYRAEDYHLDYYRRHPDEPYCAQVITPEIENFQAKFASLLKPGE